MKNKNEKFENFIRDFDTIRMTSAEKNKITENLEAFARRYVPTPSPYYSYVSFFKKSLAFALVLLLTVSVSKPASATAIPGELLYNVKIIHEEIEAATIKNPEKKVTFEIKRAEIRIREAVELAETDKLDTQTQEKLAEKIKENVAEITAEINEIKQENPEQALALNSDLKTTLKVNSEALKKVTKKKTIEKQVIVEEAVIEETPELVEEVTEETPELVEEVTEETPELAEEIVTEEVTEETPELVEEIVTEETPELVEEIEVEEESFADFILDSIEEDIEQTEMTNDSIEEEIIAEETPVIVEETVAEETPVMVEEVEETVAEETPVMAEEVEETVVEETPVIVDEVEVEEVEVEETISEDIKISEDVLIEITSLEIILAAEEKLKLLSLELNYERDPLKIEAVKEFIEEKKLGQAYIHIQNEIEFLSELKLSRELGVEFEMETNVEDLEYTEEEIQE